MICDEVMVGFGRTGQFFGFQHFEGAGWTGLQGASLLIGGVQKWGYAGVPLKWMVYIGTSYQNG
jgi:hypothetical protein